MRYLSRKIDNNRGELKKLQGRDNFKDGYPMKIIHLLTFSRCDVIIILQPGHKPYLLELLTINRQSCTITEKAPTRATTAFTFKTLLAMLIRHSLTPRYDIPYDN